MPWHIARPSCFRRLSKRVFHWSFPLYLALCCNILSSGRSIILSGFLDTKITGWIYILYCSEDYIYTNDCWEFFFSFASSIDNSKRWWKYSIQCIFLVNLRILSRQSSSLISLIDSAFSYYPFCLSICWTLYSKGSVCVHRYCIRNKNVLHSIHFYVNFHIVDLFILWRQSIDKTEGGYRYYRHFATLFDSQMICRFYPN